MKLPPCISWSVLLVTLGLPSTVAAQSDRNITLRGASGTVEIPVQGMARNEDAVRLATRIQASQAALVQWRRGEQLDQPGARRLNDLALKLQDRSIQDLGEGYHIVANTSGGFPSENKSEIQKLLDLCDKIFSHHAQFQDRVVTHISTSVTGATIHFHEYDSAAMGWSTYSDGEEMDIGGYYFQVSAPNTKTFQELVVVLDNPCTHQLAP